MVVYQLACLAFGAGLAQRFKFMVLGPAAVLVVCLGAGLEMAHAATPWRIVLVSVTSAASLQAGYLIGLGIRLRSKPPLTEPPPALRSRTPSARRSAY